MKSSRRRFPLDLLIEQEIDLLESSRKGPPILKAIMICVCVFRPFGPPGASEFAATLVSNAQRKECRFNKSIEPIFLKFIKTGSEACSALLAKAKSHRL